MLVELSRSNLPTDHLILKKFMHSLNYREIKIFQFCNFIFIQQKLHFSRQKLKNKLKRKIYSVEYIKLKIKGLNFEIKINNLNILV